MGFLTSEALSQARVEVTRSAPEQIEFETAQKWACRAVACYEVFVRTRDLTWLVRSVGYSSEAVEHAASAGPGMADAMRVELGKAITWLGS